MDVTQALRDTENALRDFIAEVLTRTFASDWVQKCGIAPERINRWRERKEIEVKRQQTGAVEERLLYYADFYDLKTILKKNWSGEFSDALGEFKTFEVWLSELEKLRDPDAHRRELLSHQKHLALGIAGEIRTRLVKYRSKRETADAYFPRIESIRDNYGSLWTPTSIGIVDTGTILRPGDTLEFIITAIDPLGEPLEYSLFLRHADLDWQLSNILILSITCEHIQANFEVGGLIRSSREYHASAQWDDVKVFRYVVLPPKKV